MLERSYSAVTKVLHFHDRTSSDMFDGLPVGFSIIPRLCHTVDPNTTFEASNAICCLIFTSLTLFSTLLSMILHIII